MSASRGPSQPKKRKPITFQPDPPLDPVAHYFGPPVEPKEPISPEEMADLIRAVNEGTLQEELFNPNDEFRQDTFGN